MAKGYWVTVYRSISDPKKVEAYAKLAPAATTPFGAKYIARGAAMEAVPDGSQLLAIPIKIATDFGVMSFLGTTTVFGTPTEVTLSELALEMWFPADAETAADAEEECGEDAEVEARDHEQVKGAGALERRSQIGSEIRAVSGDHGGKHGRVFMAEGEPGRQCMRKRAVRELHQAAAGCGLEGMLQASEAALIAVSVDVEFFRFG